MFSALDDKELDIVLDAMGEKQTAEGENIIKEGEMGEVLYVVEEGQLDCFKQFVTPPFFLP
jgi:cAMP-dependent protein kinase regulator